MLQFSDHTHIRNLQLTRFSFMANEIELLRPFYHFETGQENVAGTFFLPTTTSAISISHCLRGHLSIC